MTQLTDSDRTTYEDGAWYWVEKEGWIGDPPTIAPALYKAQSDAWYSFAFSGTPTREVKVLEPCRRALVAPVPQGWKPVPIEPTQEMQDAMNTIGHAPTRYAAMLAAAPHPPEPDKDLKAQRYATPAA